MQDHTSTENPMDTGAQGERATVTTPVLAPLHSGDTPLGALHAYLSALMAEQGDQAGEPLTVALSMVSGVLGAGAKGTMAAWFRAHDGQAIDTVQAKVHAGVVSQVWVPLARPADARTYRGRVLLDGSSRDYAGCRVVASTADALCVVSPWGDGVHVLVYRVSQPAPQDPAPVAPSVVGGVSLAKGEDIGKAEAGETSPAPQIPAPSVQVGAQGETSPMVDLSPSNVASIRNRLSLPMVGLLVSVCEGTHPVGRYAKGTRNALLSRGLLATDGPDYYVTPLGWRVWARGKAIPQSRGEDRVSPSAAAGVTDPARLYVIAAQVRAFPYAGHRKAEQAANHAIGLEMRADRLNGPDGGQGAETAPQDPAPVAPAPVLGMPGERPDDQPDPIRDNVRAIREERADRLRRAEASAKVETVDTLNARMELDSVVQVFPGRIVADYPEAYAPEVQFADGPLTGTDADLSGLGTYASGEYVPVWEALSGYSGQDRYAGPAMHRSEYIGGGMAEDILSTPGVYVAVVVRADDPCSVCGDQDGTDPDCEQCGGSGNEWGDSGEADGWAVLRLIDAPEVQLAAQSLAKAKSMGESAGKSAGSWAADGNTTPEHARRVLAMMDAGDPEVWDILPAEPNLSGEWAEDLTPLGLVCDVLDIDGQEAHDLGDHIQTELCEAWENAAQMAFSDACAEALRGVLPDDAPVAIIDGIPAESLSYHHGTGQVRASGTNARGEVSGVAFDATPAQVLTIGDETNALAGLASPMSASVGIGDATVRVGRDPHGRGYLTISGPASADVRMACPALDTPQTTTTETPEDHPVTSTPARIPMSTIRRIPAEPGGGEYFVPDNLRYWGAKLADYGFKSADGRRVYFAESSLWAGDGPRIFTVRRFDVNTETGTRGNVSSVAELAELADCIASGVRMDSATMSSRAPYQSLSDATEAARRMASEVGTEWDDAAQIVTIPDAWAGDRGMFTLVYHGGEYAEVYMGTNADPRPHAVDVLNLDCARMTGDALRQTLTAWAAETETVRAYRENA